MKPLLLDTSFLMLLAQKHPARLVESVLGGGIGTVVPDQVVQELRVLAAARNTRIARAARTATEFASKLHKVTLTRSATVDDSLVAYAAEHRLPVATLDRVLRSKLRKKGVSVVTLRGNEVWLEGRAVAELG